MSGGWRGAGVGPPRPELHEGLSGEQEVLGLLFGCFGAVGGERQGGLQEIGNCAGWRQHADNGGQVPYKYYVSISTKNLSIDQGLGRSEHSR